MQVENSTNRKLGLSRLRWRSAAVVSTLAIIVVSIVGSILITGEAPKKRAEVASKKQPPLILHDDQSRHNEIVVKVARELAKGRADEALKLVAPVAAENPGDQEVQVALALSRWNSAGSEQVLGELQSILDSEDDDAIRAWISLHLGVAQVFAGQDTQARKTLMSALRAARKNSGSFDVARRADDLLHPGLAPGYPPLLSSVDKSVAVRGDIESKAIRELLAAIEADDRRRAAGLAAKYRYLAGRRGDLDAAIAIAHFNKDDPRATLGILEREAKKANADVEAHRGVILLWSGEKAEGVAALEKSLTLGPDPDLRNRVQMIIERIGTNGS